MPTVTCPSCGEKGRVPSQFVGVRIKCKKCGNAFLVAPAAARSGAESVMDELLAEGVSAPAKAATADAGPARPRYEGIAVEGLDENAWSVGEAADHEHDQATAVAPVEDEPTGAFAPREAAPEGIKEYKILSPRDKFFVGQVLDMELMEKAINHYARQGWVVKGVAAPHVNIFGAEREQIMIVLER